MLEIKKSTVIATLLGLIFTSVLSFTLQLPEQAHRIVSPLSASMFGLQVKKKFGLPTNTFAFAPGWSVYNLDRFDFQNIDTLAFYDVPADNETGINKDNDGYLTLYSERFDALINQAHSYGSNVVFTLSQTNNVIISSILHDSRVQQQIAEETNQIIADKGLNGVTVNFEYEGDASGYKTQFTQFVHKLSTEVHKIHPQAQVSVAVPSSARSTSMYDIQALTAAADNIFIIAYDYAVPERINDEIIAPQHGYNQREYWQLVSNSIQPIIEASSLSKLSMETAWYGVGNNYPSYDSDAPPKKIPRYNTLKTPLSEKTMDNLLSGVPVQARSAARKNLPFIAKALEEEGILDENVLAYALATIEHETAGTFEPIEEIKGRRSARRLGYEGGTAYFGRGFIQLTHLRNYKRVGKRIGLGDALAQNPEMALEPYTSAKILAAFFADNGIATLARNGSFVAARRPINPDAQGYWIANLAYKYLSGII